MADVQIVAGGTSAAPLAYTVPGAAEIVLKSLFASFDGTGAGSSFLPCIRILAPGGKVVGEYVTADAVVPGGTAEVSWFPGVTARSVTPPVGQVRLIYDYLVTGSTKTSIDTGVDGSYAGAFPTDLNYLEVFLSGRTTAATKVDDISIIFNGDTGANYTRAFFASSIAGSPLQGHSVSTNSFLGVLAGGNAQANVTGLLRLFIPNYNGTTFFKVCEFTAWGSDTTTTNGTSATFPYQIGVETALWGNTAALSRIKVTSAGDFVAAGDFAIGTRLTIWGR